MANGQMIITEVDEDNEPKSLPIISGGHRLNHCLNEAQEFEREYYDAIEDYEITGEKYEDPEFTILPSYSPQKRVIRTEPLSPGPTSFGPWIPVTHLIFHWD